jgi:hypothetical protein
MFQILYFIVLIDSCFSSFVGENNFFDEMSRTHLGRPSKVVIDEIITRSVSIPAKGRYPLTDFQSRQRHPPADFMLTNRRRDDATDNDGNNYQVEGQKKYCKFLI